VTGTRQSWRAHLVDGCMSVLCSSAGAQEPMAHTIRSHWIFCTYLCIICFDTSLEKEEEKTKYIQMFYASNSWASWKSHGICYIWRGNPKNRSHQMCIMKILTIQLTLLVHIKIASFNSSFPSVVSTITCTTAHSIYVMSLCGQL